MTRRYYLLIGTSEPVSWTVNLASESEIIAQAEEECRLSGEDLEFLAGFELIGSSSHAGSIGAETLTWSRDWMPGEKFRASLLKLGDEGRTCKAFSEAIPTQVQDFLRQAASVGLRSEAETLAKLPQE